MDLFASRPGSLSLRMLASWAAGIFLQFVGAVQVRGVRGSVQFRPDAEAVDRRLGIDEIAENILVEVSAGEDCYIAKLGLIEDRSYLSSFATEISAVDPDTLDFDAASLSRRRPNE